MTLYTMRHGVGLEPVTGPGVEFLDGLLFYKRRLTDAATGDSKEEYVMRSQHGSQCVIGPSLMMEE